MLFERIVSEGLAHNSYLIGSGGIAAVIDPRRDCDAYLEIATRNELDITHIFETHRNEDYLSGALELKERCGAEIFHGARMAFAYGKPVKEGDRFTLASLELTVLETPGHTEESISLVLRDTEVDDHPYMVFSGDTLFAGDIARTDFFGHERKAEMAEKIFSSITNKILPLGDGVVLCPAHGAGSVCGEEIVDHPITTLGYEKKTNSPLMQGRNLFISRRAEESPYLPPYFQQMETLNRDGAPILHRLPDLPHLSIKKVNEFRKSGCQIVDIRSPTSFCAGHIPGSLSIWREGLPLFMGWFLDYQKPIVIVDDFNLDLDRVCRHFVRLGYDNVTGILSGGFPAWTKAAQDIGTVPTCSVWQLKERLEKEEPFLLDVRDIKNWRAVGHIPGAHQIFVGNLPQHLDEIPKNEPIVVYCDAGYKGSLAASILAISRYPDLTNLLGGMTAWNRAGFQNEK
jgi:hydroxyacylglutathione hydrolase